MTYPPVTEDGEETIKASDNLSITLSAYSWGSNGPEGELQTLFTYPLPSDCDVDQLIPSPNPIYLILEFSCHANSFVVLWDLTHLEAPAFALDRGYFLNWSLDGNWFLFRNVDADQIVLVSVDGLTQTVLENLPLGTYNAAFAPDGQSLIYTANQGLGFGSEMGLLNLTNNNLDVQMRFPNQIVASPRWSPDGKQLAYILLADNNVPYTIGELWLSDLSGEGDVLLDEVDAGRGYPPLWSPDSRGIVSVHRENHNSRQADYVAEALHSNLYQVDLATYEVISLTQFTNTLVNEATWLSEGSQLAFTANDAIWLLESGREPVQVTDSSVARHPAWISLPDR